MRFYHFNSHYLQLFEGKVKIIFDQISDPNKLSYTALWLPVGIQVVVKEANSFEFFLPYSLLVEVYGILLEEACRQIEKRTHRL